AVAERMRAAGASDTEVRLLLTFTSAMDRAREADSLWFAAERLWAASPWVFSPEEVVRRGIIELGDQLRRHHVSQRHGSDSAAWRTIAEALADAGTAPPVREAVLGDHGNASELLGATQASSPGGTPFFPLLRGPKIGPMWVRMLAYPGGAEIESLDA